MISSLPLKKLALPLTIVVLAFNVGKKRMNRTTNIGLNFLKLFNDLY